MGRGGDIDGPNYSAIVRDFIKTRAIGEQFTSTQITKILGLPEERLNAVSSALSGMYRRGMIDRGMELSVHGFVYTVITHNFFRSNGRLVGNKRAVLNKTSIPIIAPNPEIIAKLTAVAEKLLSLSIELEDLAEEAKRGT